MRLSRRGFLGLAGLAITPIPWARALSDSPPSLEARPMSYGGFSGYEPLGDREILADVIYNVSRIDTPRVFSARLSK